MVTSHSKQNKLDIAKKRGAACLGLNPYSIVQQLVDQTGHNRKVRSLSPCSVRQGQVSGSRTSRKHLDTYVGQLEQTVPQLS
jgi:hypothetical protein